MITRWGAAIRLPPCQSVKEVVFLHLRIDERCRDGDSVAAR